MARAVLDSSAILALLLREPGWQVVDEVIASALVSTVNLAEVISKLLAIGSTWEDVRVPLQSLGGTVVLFDRVQAELAGQLVTRTRAAGLSLGDRACLALAEITGLPAYTADRIWMSVRGQVQVVLIR